MDVMCWWRGIVHSYVTALNESAEKADFPQNLNSYTHTSFLYASLRAVQNRMTR